MQMARPPGCSPEASISSWLVTPISTTCSPAIYLAIDDETITTTSVAEIIIIAGTPPPNHCQSWSPRMLSGTNHVDSVNDGHVPPLPCTTTITNAAGEDMNVDQIHKHRKNHCHETWY